MQWFLIRKDCSQSSYYSLQNERNAFIREEGAGREEEGERAAFEYRSMAEGRVLDSYGLTDSILQVSERNSCANSDLKGDLERMVRVLRSPLLQRWIIHSDHLHVETTRGSRFGSGWLQGGYHVEGEQRNRKAVQ